MRDVKTELEFPIPMPFFPACCREVVNSRRVAHGHDGHSQMAVDYLVKPAYFPHVLREALGESCSSSHDGLPHLRVADRGVDYFGGADPEEGGEFDRDFREVQSAAYVHRRPPARLVFRGVPSFENRNEEDGLEGEAFPGLRYDEPGTWLHACGVGGVQALSPREAAGELFFEPFDGRVVRLQAGLGYRYLRFTLLFEKKPYRVHGDSVSLAHDGDVHFLNSAASVPLDVDVRARDPEHGLPAGGIKGRLTLYRYVARFLLPAAKMERVPFARLKWASDGLAEANLDHQLLRSSEVVYNWHEVPASHRQELRVQRYLGTVNRYHFDGFPPGTLRLDGMAVRTYRPYHGALLQDIVLFANHVDRDPDTRTKPLGLGHNYVPLWGTSPGSTVEDYSVRYVADADGRPPYQPADWSYIFLPYDEL